MRPKVEKELDRLEQEGVIFKVPTSDWATPIVPIAKKSGDVRICRDLKVTINPHTVEKFWSTCATFSLILPCMLIC
jgi:hypothetical protein